MLTLGALGDLPVSAFTCSTSGVCSGSSIFAVLQTQLNRVRPHYGLAANVTVDGKIGKSTLAAVIVTAQAIQRDLESHIDPILVDYTQPDIAYNMTPKMLAFQADGVVAALSRNGYAAGDPGAAASGVLAPNGIPIFPPLPGSTTGHYLPPWILHVGPTQLAPGANPVVTPSATPGAGTSPIGTWWTRFWGAAKWPVIGVGAVGATAALVAGGVAIARRPR